MENTVSSYGKKVLLNKVGSFCDALSKNPKTLGKMAKSLIDLDSDNADDTFLMARAIGYAIQAYQAFDPKENAARLTDIAEEITVAESRDPSMEIMSAMAEADDADKPSIIASYPVIVAEIATTMDTLCTERNSLMLGAAIDFRNAWDTSLRFGEPREVTDGGDVVVKLDIGVYRVTFKSHTYRIVFQGATNWAIFEVNAKALTPIATFATVSGVEFLADGKTPVMTSPTKARKFCKVAYTGYRGYSEHDLAMASAVNAGFEALSAGNPTTANFCLVTADIAEWVGQSKDLTTLPVETTTPKK